MTTTIMKKMTVEDLLKLRGSVAEEYGEIRERVDRFKRVARLLDAPGLVFDLLGRGHLLAEDNVLKLLDKALWEYLFKSSGAVAEWMIYRSLMMVKYIKAMPMILGVSLIRLLLALMVLQILVLKLLGI